ncbi:MAG: exosome complex RNA-binding protein Csl4 [Candidatus Kariarchaeaceae archaeon]|jgi:exosome complex RNA-binding protein Csl4
MTKSSKTDGKKSIIYPSEKIGVEEEFLASKTTTYVENHEVRSAVIGNVFVDRSRYEAKVYPLNRGSTPPSRYDTVIGHVIKVSKSTVRVSIGYVNKKPLNPTPLAIMHISDASRDYIDDLDDFYLAGDIIRAKIIDAKTFPLQLEAKSKDHGVIATTCKFCGKAVKKIKRNMVKCEECGKEQSRMTAIDFGNVNFVPEY